MTVKFLRNRPGTSLVELLMFLAFFALCSGILIGVLVSSSEQRTRQQTIASVEQEGMQLLQMLTRRMRRAERIAYPAMGASNSVLVLQLADEVQDPTVIALETGAIKVAEGNSVRTVSSNGLTISDLTFRNTSVSADAQSSTISFTITKVIPLPTAGTYSRIFEALVTLFPDHQRTGNACTCSAPSCSDEILTWGVCDGETCETSTGSLPCG
ncbi:hypothetical protein KKC44_03555 [Patescibacteria group bacterium]|nr:hypothetical protein [Patescibacteria group bacterium]MBU2259660.1 hypothetical protein [Patescibacteria group bacterium]